jgi:hypothetical protein
LSSIDPLAVRAWLANLHRPPLSGADLVAAYGGLGWGELVGLRVKRVDLSMAG